MEALDCVQGNCPSSPVPPVLQSASGGNANRGTTDESGCQVGAVNPTGPYPVSASPDLEVPHPEQSTPLARATHVLRSVLGEKGLPAGDAAVYEGLAGLARAVRAISAWMPDAQEWQDLGHFLDVQAATRIELLGAYSSRVAPTRWNPLYGDYKKFPLYSAIVAGEQVPESREWALLAGLSCWPLIDAVLRGREPPEMPKGVSGVYPLLRQYASNTSSRIWLDDLLAAGNDPGSVLEAIARLPAAEQKTERVQGISALAQQCIAGMASRQPPQTSDDDDDEAIPSGIETESSNSVVDPATEGLAPEDQGQSQTVLSVETEDDPSRIRARTIAAARDFNHCSLHWDSLTPEEVEYFSTTYPSLIQEQATQDGATGLALMTATGLPLDRISRLRLAESLDDVDAMKRTGGVAIVSLGGRLVVMQAAANPDNAAKQDQTPGYLPVSSRFFLALPNSCAEALAASGWQAGETITRRFPTLASDARAVLTILRAATGHRLTSGRLRTAIAKEIHAQTQDECVASMIHPAARIPVGAGRYYLSITCQEAADHQVAAMARLFPGDIERLQLPNSFANRYIGSELVVPPEHVVPTVTALWHRLSRTVGVGRRTIAKVADALNAHSNWMAALAKLVAFVRPIVDPLPRPTDVVPEQGFALVCDKRETPRNEQRLIPLPAIMIEQSRLLRDTHEAAALFFDAHAPDLAAGLRSLHVDGPGCASIPALPILVQQSGRWSFREFRPEDLVWPEFGWASNLGRHIGSRVAKQHGLSREIVSLLLGHAEIGQTPFGWDSVLTPRDVQQLTQPYFDGLASAYGFQVLPALSRHGLGADKLAPNLLRAPVFGDSRPARNEKRRLTEGEKAHVRKAARAATVLTATSESDALQAMKRQLGESLRGNLVERKWLHSIAERYLHFLWRTKDDPSPKGALRIPLEADTGPVDRAELFLAERGRQTRDELLRVIQQFLAESPHTRQHTEWLALIALCAAAFGGCLQPNGMEGLAKACGSGLRHHEGMLLLDWTTERGAFRFIPDAVTASLLLKWIQERPALPDDLDLTAFRKAVGKILSRIDALGDAPYAWPASTTRATRLRLAIGALLRQSVPGVLMAHLLGVRRSSPVPVTCLQRELGIRLDLPAEEPASEGSFRLALAGAPKASASGVIKLLRKRIGEIRSSGTTGGKAKGKRGERIAHLEEDVKAIESSLATLTGQHEVPAITHMVIARLRHLVKKGGRLKKVLATSTIAEYMAPVLTLAESAIGHSILSADPSELAAAYRAIILSGASSTANARYRALEDFHQLAVEQFGLEDLDWTDIAEDVPGVVVRVDANLAHPHEVDLAISLIDGCLDVPPDLRLRAQLVIALMADVGLRFGEIYRLRHADISPARRFAFVRNTRDGEVKTGNGVRTLPIGALCKPRTLQLLAEVIALTDLKGDMRNEAVLFGSVANARDLIPRAIVARLANQALRVATGDPSMRLHHLRHGAATSLFDRIVLPDDRLQEAKLLEEIVGTTAPTRRALWSLAMLMGHGSGRTTTVSYVHHQERRVAIAMDRALPPLSDVLVGLLIGQTPSAVRSYRSRGKNDASILSNHLRKSLARMPELAVTYGMQQASSPPILHAAWLSADVIDPLRQIDHALRLHFHGRLDADAAGLASGLTASEIACLADTARRLASEMQLPVDARGNPACFTTPRSRFAVASNAVPGVAEIAHSDEARRLAAEVIRAYDHGRFAWCCRDLYALRSILAWLRLAGLNGKDIQIQAPVVRRSEVKDFLAQAAPDAPQLRLTEGRRGRTRGVDRIEISVVSTRGTGLNHASFLQLLRWTAFQ